MKMNYQAVYRELGFKGVIPTLMDFVKVTRKGIPKRSLDILAKKMDIAVSELAKYLHVSERTLQRYKPDKILSADLSDHILQITRVFTRCLEVFNNKKDAKNWLKQPNTAFGNALPIGLLDTSTGIEMVLDELDRIEYGVYS